MSSILKKSVCKITCVERHGRLALFKMALTLYCLLVILEQTKLVLGPVTLYEH